MNKSEGTPTGVRTERINDHEYIVCSLGVDSKVEDYLKGTVPCVRFRLPAIKTDETPNEDGMYRLYQLTYVITNGVIALYEVALIKGDGEDDFKAYYNLRDKQIYYTNTIAGRYATEGHYIRGEKTFIKYYCAIWNYFVSSGDATGR